MARLLWLPDVLRAAGLTVHEYDGWRDRGKESFGPVIGIQVHETQGSLTSTDAGELRTIAITGSTTARAPVAQLYLSRSGQWWVVASGTCNHNKVGWAGPNKGYGNDALLGIEAQHAAGEPWSATQYESYVVGVAALVRALGCPVWRVSGHKEHQPGQKTDPGFDMNIFRRDVAAVLGGDDVSAEDVWNYQVDAVSEGYRAAAVEYLKWIIVLVRQNERIEKTLALLAQSAGVDERELAVIRDAARAGAEAGLLSVTEPLARGIAEHLVAEIGLTVEQAQAAVAAVLRRLVESNGGARPHGGDATREPR